MREQQGAGGHCGSRGKIQHRPRRRGGTLTLPSPRGRGFFLEQDAAWHLGGQGYEQFGVGVGLLGALDDGGVAAGFAFAADPGGDDPDGGVEEEQRFDDPLQEVDEVVPAADVGQLVQEDHFDFVGAPAGEGGRRQQDHGADDADEDG